MDLARDEAFIASVAKIARGATRAEVLAGVGGFAGLFEAPTRYKNPVFVAGADGVGTKLRVAAQLGRYESIGLDCVAMVVNDLIVQGAEPLVFLDYLAMGELDEARAAEALRGVAEGCRRAGCALLGGETASMPGFYARAELELVGFGVGVVERERVITGAKIQRGDAIVGVASSGLHANGFSLAREIVERGLAAEKFALHEALPDGGGTTLADALLEPTRIYVQPVLALLREFEIHGIAHITGGGFLGNVPRVLPESLRARLVPSAWPRLPIFDFLKTHGEISEDEMRRVFNCGLGLLLFVPRRACAKIVQRLTELGERAYEVGRVEARTDGDGDAALVFDPPPTARAKASAATAGDGHAVHHNATSRRAPV